MTDPQEPDELLRLMIEAKNRDVPYNPWDDIWETGSLLFAIFGFLVLLSWAGEGFRLPILNVTGCS